jgi:uncharacterized membrane protein YhaH (DUF805 family)
MTEMPDVAENGSYAEAPRGSSNAWNWIFSPNGRMGRADFFYAVLARAFAIALPLAFLPPEIGLAVPVWTIAVILTAGGPTVRRLHDLGRNGLHAPWLCFSLVLGCVLLYQLPRPLSAANCLFYLLASLPYLLVLALMLWPGNPSPNRYCPPPA